MHQYTFLKTREVQHPTAGETRAFSLARAEIAERWAAYWEEQGDKDQAQRFRDEAASLRGG
jgi:hypothetical protein